MLSRRSFCAMLGMGSLSLVGGEAPAKVGRGVDGNFAVLLSDPHVGFQGGGATYQEERFAGVARDILAMDPLPGNVVVFGDMAYMYGHAADYERSRKYVNQLIDAGVNVTIGMGNHDRRKQFAEVYPQLASKTLLKDRMVFSVEVGGVDLLMLDTLQEGPGEDGRQNKVSGALDREQQEWLEGRLSALGRPTFICAHHDIREVRIRGESILDRVLMNANVAGYIHGHHHQWKKSLLENRKLTDGAKRMLCLPSTGHWGDIGYVTFNASPGKARAKLVQKEYFMPRPSKTPPKVWQSIASDNNGEVCTFDC